jgi:mono/diheme cytochrome c family protein
VFVAGAAGADDAALFESKIRPILVEHCYECHSADKKHKGNLLLDTKDAVLKGGDTGPALVPGDPVNSLLIKAVKWHGGLEMPPKKKLGDSQIADLEAWIKAGAPDPRTGPRTLTKIEKHLEDAKKHWSFQPVVDPKPASLDALTSLAAQKKLRDPAVLRAQTERLLGSPMAKRFTRNFLGSWLNLRDIDFTQPDTKLYPEFEQYLQQSMVAETERFFEELLQNNLSVRNIVHSEFAMLNERLAEHYGIPGVKGEQVRKVNLAAGSRRGGFLTQGAVLKVSANGTSTSPVVRGAYVLDRILGTPPDPPPKNVPAIEPDIRGATTIREQLDKHRNQPACAGCHARLDPPGFALENYDVTGRWRTIYRAIPESAKDKVVTIPGTDVRYYTQGKPVDASFAMADGRAFKDVDEFKQIVLADPQQLARCVTEKLLVHFTGASIQFADREVIEDIVQRAKADDHGLRTLLHEVIQSRVFTHK